MERMKSPYEILEIQKDANEDVIKKAYRDLAKKYHPDANPGNKQAEEMFKKVQNAYEELFKNFNQSKSSYTNNINLDALKKEKIDKLKSSCPYGVTISYKYDQQITKIERICSQIFDSTSINEINHLFEKGMELILNFYKGYAQDFMIDNNIFESYLHDDEEDGIIFDCTFKKLQSQLNRLLKKYQKNNIKHAIDELIDKYRLCAGFEYLESEINKLKSDYLRFLKNNKKDKDTVIEQIEEQINSLFDIYYNNLAKMNELNTEKINDEKILNLLQRLRNNLISSDFDKDYQILKRVILKNQNQIYFEENKENLANLFYCLKEKEVRVLTDSFNIGNTPNIYYVGQLDLYIYSLFMKARDGLIEPFSLIKLENLSFENPLEDAGLLHSIYYNLDQILTNNIYVNKEMLFICWLTFDKDSYYINQKEFDYFDNCYKIKNKKTNLEEVGSNYISLDEILNKSEFVGKDVYLLNEPYPITILYHYMNLNIVYNQGKIQMMEDMAYQLVKNNDQINEFADKEYIKKLILDSINELYNKEENANLKRN